MKNIGRIISVLLVISLLFVLCSCSFDAGKISSDKPTENEDVYEDYVDEVPSDDSEKSSEEDSTTVPTTVPVDLMTPEELEAEISKQEVKVIATEYVVQDEEYKVLYPDLLSATVQNNSDVDIKNAVVAYVAWDENNLPVKIIGKHDYSDGSYIKNCNFSDINLVPGKSYGSESGLPLDDGCDTIHTFKAIVISYEGFDGETWTNPYAEEWTALYSGKKLPS